MRSLLQDAVDERAGDGQPTEQTATKVLLDFGPPEQMAAQYHATQYVIGPQLYPFYRFVATIVLSVMAVLYLVLMILTLVTGDSADTASVIWNFLLEFAQAAVISLGVITLIFAGIERVWGGNLSSTAIRPNGIRTICRRSMIQIDQSVRAGSRHYCHHCLRRHIPRLDSARRCFGTVHRAGFAQ